MLTGVWVITQVTRGEALERLGIIPFSKKRLDEMAGKPDQGLLGPWNPFG